MAFRYDDARLGWIAAALLVTGCNQDGGGVTITGLSAPLTTFPSNGGDDDDDDDGDSTGSPTTGGSETSGSTAEQPTTGPTSVTSADTSTSEGATTEACTPGTAGCSCEAGSCVGDLVCSNDVCTSPNCGDGKVDPGEGCDDGAGNGPGKACLEGCVVNACGDGDKGPGEACDNGQGNSNAGMCTATCELAVCGDGKVWAGQEECDDAAGNGDTKACLSSCKQNVCGDGFLEVGEEECDDGNSEDQDGCLYCEIELLTEYVSVTDLDLSIPDNGYNGSQGSMACADLAVVKSFDVTHVTVALALNHTYIGDLTIKLYSPDSKVLTLMSRPGLIEAADNGTGVGGDSSNISFFEYVEFRDGGDTDAESMGAILDDSTGVCDVDGLCDYYPNKGAASGLSNFAGFNGIQAKGVWRLCVGDSRTGDTGYLHAVDLIVNYP